jgi:diacylglycerol kinase (ATP)
MAEVPSPSQSERSFLRARAHSLRFALRGLGVMLRSQHNAWLHAGATVVVVAGGFFCALSRWEWCALVLAIVAVWTAEALNTAFEFLADVASPEFHPLVEKAKDVAAGAVLMTATGALAVGFILFGPRIWDVLRR